MATPQDKIETEKKALVEFWKAPKELTENEREYLKQREEVLGDRFETRESAEMDLMLQEVNYAERPDGNVTARYAGERGRTCWVVGKTMDEVREKVAEASQERAEEMVEFSQNAASISANYGKFLRGATEDGMGLVVEIDGEEFSFWDMEKLKEVLETAELEEETGNYSFVLDGETYTVPAGSPTGYVLLPLAKSAAELDSVKVVSVEKGVAGEAKEMPVLKDAPILPGLKGTLTEIYVPAEKQEMFKKNYDLKEQMNGEPAEGHLVACVGWDGVVSNFWDTRKAAGKQLYTAEKA